MRRAKNFKKQWSCGFAEALCGLSARAIRIHFRIHFAWQGQKKQ